MRGPPCPGLTREMAPSASSVWGDGADGGATFPLEGVPFHPAGRGDPAPVSMTQTASRCRCKREISRRLLSPSCGGGVVVFMSIR
jgi:hypothetical protein